MVHRPRVLQVLPSFDVGFGGPVNSGRAVALAYSRFAHVLTIGPAGENSAVWPVDVEMFTAHKIVPGGRQWVNNFSYGMVRWLRSHANDFDLIHIHMNRGLITLPAAFIATGARVPVVIQTHGMLTAWNGIRSVVDQLTTNPILARGDLFMTLTEDESLNLQSRGARRSLVVANAVTDRAQLGNEWDDKSINLLFAARLHSRKGLMTALEALGLLHERGFHASIRIAGADEGALGGATAYANRHGLPFSWLGVLDRPSLRSEMLRSFALLHPAPYEPFGMSMVEAMSCGLPVIAAASSVLAPIMREKNAALLIPDNDISAWANAVENLYTNPQSRTDIARNAVALVNEKFSIDHLADVLEDALRELLDEAANVAL